MIKIENVETYGWDSAIRGMRNPMNSWDKSDSFYGCFLNGTSKNCNTCGNWYACKNIAQYCIGSNDLALMKNLVKAGTDHRKFLRMINVSFDTTVPLYWWKEFDTYKIATVRNSCSTMHKIHAKEFTLDDFSHEHLTTYSEKVLLKVIEVLNFYRNSYINKETKDCDKKMFWWQMIQLLPSSYNQRATIQLNYEVLLNMYHSRKNHKLDEWREFCKWIESLPYMKEFINI